MNNSKLQQVFYRIILDSLNDDKKGLYKQAIWSYLWKPFRSLWDFGKALLASRRAGQGLRDAEAILAKGEQFNNPEKLEALRRNLDLARKYLPNPGDYDETLIKNIKDVSPYTYNILLNKMPDLIRGVGPWQLMKANPFKTIGLGSTAGALATGGYYGTRYVLRDLFGTNPTTVGETVQQGIYEGLKKALQDTGLGEIGRAQQLQSSKVMPSTTYGVSNEELGKLLRRYLLQSNKTASAAFPNDIVYDSNNSLPGIRKLFFSKNAEESNQNKSLLEMAGSLMDPLVSLTGKDPNTVPNVSKLLLLAGLTSGTASLFKRKNKWLPWLGGGLVLSGLGSSFLLDPKLQQGNQNTTTGGGVSNNQQQQ